MTPEERVALLRSVAEVAPEWMHIAPFVETAHGIELQVATGPDGYESQALCQGSWHRLTNDFVDASLIIAMMDAMEADGWNVGVGGKYLTDEGLCYLCEPTHAGMVSVRHYGCGQTRAEAVARAFIACFRAKVGGGE